MFLHVFGLPRPFGFVLCVFWNTRRLSDVFSCFSASRPFSRAFMCVWAPRAHTPRFDVFGGSQGPSAILLPVWGFQNPQAAFSLVFELRGPLQSCFYWFLGFRPFSRAFMSLAGLQGPSTGLSWRRPSTALLRFLRSGSPGPRTGMGLWGDGVDGGFGAGAGVGWGVWWHAGPPAPLIVLAAHALNSC